MDKSLALLIICFDWTTAMFFFFFFFFFFCSSFWDPWNVQTRNRRKCVPWQSNHFSSTFIYQWTVRVEIDDMHISCILLQRSLPRGGYPCIPGWAWSICQALCPCRFHAVKIVNDKLKCTTCTCLYACTSCCSCAKDAPNETQCNPYTPERPIALLRPCRPCIVPPVSRRTDMWL